MSARRQAIFGSLLVSLALSGCVQPHRAPIAQGNVINKEDAARLETGMSRAQVEYLIGRPILKEPFQQSRWNYVFYSRIGQNKVVQRRVSLYFEGDTLARMEGDLEATADQVVENQLEQTDPEGNEEPPVDPAERPADPTDPSPDPGMP